VLVNITPHCRDVLNELLAVDGHVVKDKFINAYVEVINSHQLLRYTCAVSFYFLKNFFRSKWSKSPKWWQN